MKREINPKETSRAYAFDMWMRAPVPMVTLFKTLDVTRAVRKARRDGLKFNMLMCWCVGRAASGIREFYMLPEGDRLMCYDSIAVCTIVANRQGGVNSCDIPFSDDLQRFNSDYLQFTGEVAEACADRELPDSMVIGTSALPQCDLDGAVGMYTGFYNNPFLIWGRYRRGLFKTTLPVSFQFHHTQLDGSHAAAFLAALQAALASL